MQQEPLRILLLGSGGREHALTWKLSQSHLVEAIYILPGNSGIQGLQKASNIDATFDNDFELLLKLVEQRKINFVIPTQERHLFEGISDFFNDAGVPCLGPSKLAARLEGSKAFAKEFMRRHKIPTANYKAFHHLDAASFYVKSCGDKRMVIKASGLTAGKGVIITQSTEQALRALEEIVEEFGPMGLCWPILIEDYLSGPEFSVVVLTDGSHHKTLPPIRDYKRLRDGNEGPNTGGMGCHAPTPLCSAQILDDIETDVIKPTIAGIKAEGSKFAGILCIDFIITEAGPMTLEYDVRFGDPETQTILSLLSSETDLAKSLLACTNNTLHECALRMVQGYSVTVVAVAQGYPENSEVGLTVQIGEIPHGALAFHAGLKLVNGVLVSSGGRVIGVCATGQTLGDATKRAYDALERIQFQGMHFRKEISKEVLC